jgi:hypothetical protein
MAKKTYTVYFLCDQHQTPFYVGCTVNYKTRLWQHLTDAKKPRGDSTVGAFLKHKKMVEIYESGGEIVGQVIFQTPDKELASNVERAILRQWDGRLTNWIGRPRYLRSERPASNTSGTSYIGDFWRAEMTEKGDTDNGR